VIDEVTGIVVDPRDLAGFGRAVCRLLDDDALAARLGAAARERVRDQFLEPRHLRQWVNLIELLTPATARGPATGTVVP
jgi:trehalose synthase